MFTNIELNDYYVNSCSEKSYKDLHDNIHNLGGKSTRLRGYVFIEIIYYVHHLINRMHMKLGQ